MKKFFSTITALLALLAGSSLSVAPAFAAVLPESGYYYPVVVGDPVNLDLGCQEEGVTSVSFGSGNLPDGLTIDSQGLVTGIPTTVGDYTIGNYSCYWGSDGINSENWGIVFNVLPITPEPFLDVHNLNTENCSFYVSYLFPETPDDGKASLTISNQAGTRANLSLVSRNSNQLYENTYLISELNDVGNNNLDGSLTNGSAPFTCGDTIEATLRYKWRNIPAADKTVSGVVVSKLSVTPTAGGHPIQKLINLNNQNCEFRILASIPSPAKAGSTTVTVVLPSPGTDQITFTIADSMVAKLIDFTFTPEELASGSVVRDGIIAIDNQISTSWSCGSTFSVGVDYIDLLDNYRSSPQAPELQTDGFTVTPTKPEVIEDPEASITAVQSNLGTCNISIVATVPDAWRPIAIGITSVDSTEWITAVTLYESGLANGVITVNLSFTSIDGIFANVPFEDEDRTLNGTPVCSGTFRAIIDSMEGNLATTTFTLGQTMPTCNAGSILDEEQYRCIAVERGFYTTELNSSTPIACPAGMTTSTTASKSVNDCYKPIVQNIVGLKSPKALKYKASTNLAIITNTKSLATYKVTGPCTAKVANIVTKVKGKKVTTKMLKVTGGKKAGSCQIDFLSPSSGKYLELRKVVKIKVSKTGK
jgi:hypothetical protein